MLIIEVTAFYYVHLSTSNPNMRLSDIPPPTHVSPPGRTNLFSISFFSENYFIAPLSRVVLSDI